MGSKNKNDKGNKKQKSLKDMKNEYILDKTNDIQFLIDQLNVFHGIDYNYDELSLIATVLFNELDDDGLSLWKDFLNKIKNCDINKYEKLWENIKRKRNWGFTLETLEKWRDNYLEYDTKLDLPSINDKNDPTEFSCFNVLTKNKYIDKNKILNLMRRTCAYIYNGGKYFILTKYFNDGVLEYMQFSDMHRFEKIKFVYFIEIEDRKGNVEVVKHKTDLAKIMDKYKHLIMYKSCKFIPYTNFEEFKKINDESIFNTFTGFYAIRDDKLVINMDLILPILDHIKNIWCQKNEVYYDYVLNWLSHLLQKPYKKIGVVLVLKSEEGAGKNIVCDFFGRYILGEPKYYVVLNDVECLTGKFNSLCAHKILTICDEFGNHVNTNMSGKIKDKLKNIITQNKQIIEKKGFDPTQENDYNNFILLTNNKSCVQIDPSDRRYFCMELSNEKINDYDYFNKIDECNNTTSGIHMYNYLLRRNISSWKPQHIPSSTMKTNLILENLEKPILFIMNILDAKYEPTTNLKTYMNDKNFTFKDKIFSCDLYDIFVYWLKEDHNITNSSTYNINNFTKSLVTIGMHSKKN